MLNIKLSIFIIITVTFTLLLGCSFGQSFEIGEHLESGEWYQEHDFELGNSSISGSLDLSSVTFPDGDWEASAIHITVQKCLYTDNTVLETPVRDERIVPNRETGVYLIEGLPSWEKDTETYIRIELYKYTQPYENGWGYEGVFYSKNFTTTDDCENPQLILPEYKVLPVNPDLSVTINILYYYGNITSGYSVKTYSELSALVNVDTTDCMGGASGFGADNWANILITPSAADYQNQTFLIENVLAGGVYRSFGLDLIVDGVTISADTPEGTEMSVNADNPARTIDLKFYIEEPDEEP